MRLGDRLQHMGLVSADQIQIALLEQRKTGKQLGDTLIALGFVTEEAMREALGQTLGQQTIQLQTVLADPEALARLPKAMALRFQVFPVSFQAETQKLVLASPKPNDIIAGDQIRAHVGLGVSISWRLASAADVLAAIDQFYGYELSIDGIIQEIETGQIDMASLSQGQGGYSHPVVRLVDALLSDAVQKLASDIHFEPEGQFLRIRYRIDGVLRQVRVLHGRYWNAMLVRLKLVAGMNIAESRAPRGGAERNHVDGRRQTPDGLFDQRPPLRRHEPRRFHRQGGRSGRMDGAQPLRHGPPLPPARCSVSGAMAASQRPTPTHAGNPARLARRGQPEAGRIAGAALCATPAR